EENKTHRTYIKFNKDKSNSTMQQFALYSANMQHLLTNLKIYNKDNKVFKIFNGIATVDIKYNNTNQDCIINFNIDDSQIEAKTILLQLISFSSIAGITKLLENHIFRTQSLIKTNNIYGTIIYNPQKQKQYFKSQFHTELFSLNISNKSFITPRQVYLQGTFSPHAWGINKIASLLLINNKLSNILLKQNKNEQILQIPFSKNIKL
ncbi:MAG: hypothetical protein AAFO15_01465, partial [Pseudomonadota bacterium]